MKTPAGKECKFYYEDFNRGRNRQECRLIPRAAGAAGWRPGDCARCPVPDILWANASEHLELRAHIVNGFLGFGRHVRIAASCRKHNVEVRDPYAGCEQCARDRPGLPGIFGQGDS